MKPVTRNIDPDSARDLLERVPRACLAFAHDNGPQAQPVALLWRDNRYFTGITGTEPRLPVVGQEVVLLVDAGVYFFDLRAIYIRGTIQPAQSSIGAPAGRVWFEVIPARTVAWDYGTLRELVDER